MLAELSTEHCVGRADYREKLGELVGTYEREFLDIDPTVVGSRKQLLEAFKTTERFNWLYGMAVSVYAVPMDEESLLRKHSYFVGAVFQELAFLYLSLHEREGKLLSPENTLALFGSFFPDAEVIENPFGLRSLKGISVPDFLEVDNSLKVTCVYEASVTGRIGYFEDKTQHFEGDRELFPQILSGAGLIFVRPFSPGAYDFPRAQGFKTQYLPISHKQVRDFGDTLYYHKRMGADSATESATLYEVQQRAWEQVSHGEELRRAGLLTPEYAHYLRKVGA